MPADQSTLTVEVYTRPHCHLCEAAFEMLEALQQIRGFRLVERNILDEPEWFDRFRYRVPVVHVNGVERLALRFSREDVEAVLDEHGSAGG
jgi:glutaredoxin